MTKAIGIEYCTLKGNKVSQLKQAHAISLEINLSAKKNQRQAETGFQNDGAFPWTYPTIRFWV